MKAEIMRFECVLQCCSSGNSGVECCTVATLSALATCIAFPLPSSPLALQAFSPSCNTGHLSVSWETFGAWEGRWNGVRKSEWREGRRKVMM